MHRNDNWFNILSLVRLYVRMIVSSSSASVYLSPIRLILSGIYTMRNVLNSTSLPHEQNSENRRYIDRGHS